MSLLIELYDDLDKDGLIEELKQFESKDTVVPIGDLIYILNDTMDIELTLFIMEIFYIRINDVDDQLMAVYPNVSDVLKRHFIELFAMNSKSKYMQFLLGEYFNNPYMRPLIRKKCFEQKFYLFINLVRYFEDVKLTDDAISTAQQILKTIPRDVVLKSGTSFSGTKLMDVYYAISPDDRKK